MYLKIIKAGEGRYNAILTGSNGSRTIAAGLDFEYCFGTSELLLRKIASYSSSPTSMLRGARSQLRKSRRRYSDQEDLKMGSTT